MYFFELINRVIETRLLMLALFSSLKFSISALCCSSLLSGSSIRLYSVEQYLCLEAAVATFAFCLFSSVSATSPLDTALKSDAVSLPTVDAESF